MMNYKKWCSAFRRVTVSIPNYPRNYVSCQNNKKCCEKNFEKKEIKISAQAYLEKFYIDLGFERRGDGYIEDGIPHCAMFMRP